MNTLPAPSALPALTKLESRDSVALRAIAQLRLAGLFLLLPVLSVYASGLRGAAPLLAGIAVGAYGLGQTLLHIPGGMLADRFGRKPAACAGLLVCALGCILAAVSSSLSGLIVGLLLMGSGSTGSLAPAMTADPSRDGPRKHGMATIGTSILGGGSLGFLLGSILAAHAGVQAIFWILAALETTALVYMALSAPEPGDREKSAMGLAFVAEVLRDRNLFPIDAMMFLLHFGLTSVFVVTPFLLGGYFHKQDQWEVYLPMILLGAGATLPAISWTEKRKKLQELLLLGIFAAGAGYYVLAGSPNHEGRLIAGLLLYFIGFNLVRLPLPSLLGRFAPTFLRGTALGVLDLSQTLGVFCGGAVGGLFLGHNPYLLFPFLLVLSMPWFWAASRLDNPAHIREARFAAKSDAPHHAADLRRIHGVYDAHWLPSGELEVRYSAKMFDQEHLRHYLKNKGLL